MNVSEVYAAIAKIAAIDPRFVAADEVKIREKGLAWHSTLTPDMDFRWALEAVSVFYGREVRSIMPADLNAGWKSVRSEMLDRRQVAALEVGEPVPMPAYVRDLLPKMRSNL